MAHEESDREDLLREATALAERIELSPTQGAQCATGSIGAPDFEIGEPIVIGFRPNGAASFFFGADPVYQFNAAKKLRRAYCDGRLFKAVTGQLVSLERVRSTNQVELRRHELSAEERREFLDRLRARLQSLEALLANGKFAIKGQVPTETDVLARVKRWLSSGDNITVAAAPNA